MAKERMITRTISTSKVTVTVADLRNNSITEYDYTLAGKYDANSALEAVKELHETDTLKMLVVKNVEVSEKLYGMREQFFMKHATELPPR